MSREIPANTDAEQGLLASCIIDPALIVRAEEHGITATSFFAPVHGILWESVRAVHSAGTPVDEISVCEMLHRRGQLDAVGGHAEVNRLTNRVESTANALFWVKVVRDKALQRRLISHATSLVERAYAGEEIAEVLARAESGVAELITATAQGEGDAPPLNPGKARAEAKLLAKANANRFDPSKPPKEAPWLLKLCGTELLHGGNILSIIAPQKSGKSTTQSAMIASLFGMEGSDFLGFQGRNEAGRAVIHFDTEQSEMDHFSMMVRTLRRARWTDFPAWFTSLHIRRFSSEDRRKIVLASARKAAAETGLLAIMVDGLVDLLQDFNDVREATGLINDLMALCEETGCAIITTLHVNPGSQKGKESDKGRGHLGTMLEQKSETILLLKKEFVQGDDLITIATKDARHGGLKEPPSFRWCNETKMHVTASVGDGFTALPSLASRKAEELATLARDIFDKPDIKIMNFAMVRERTMQACGCARATSERKINELLRAGLIRKTDSGHYGLA